MNGWQTNEMNDGVGGKKAMILMRSEVERFANNFAQEQREAKEERRLKNKRPDA